MDLEKKKPKVIKRDERKPPPSREAMVARMEKRYRAMQSLTNLFKKDLEELRNGNLG